MSRTGKITVLVLLMASSLVSLVFLSWVAFNLRLISDDYCTAQAASSQGIFQFIFFQYQNWTGAFIAAVANSALGTWMAGTLNTFPYLVWIIGSVFVATISIYLLLISTSTPLRRRSKLGFLVISVAAYVAFVLGQFGIPSDMSSVNFAFGYMWLGWVAAGLSQIIPAVLFVLAVGSLIRFEQYGLKIYLIATAVLATILGQFNFLAALAFTLLMAFRVVYTLISSRRLSRVNFYLMLLAIFGALLNYFAPGTRERANLITQGQDLYSFDRILASSKALLESILTDSLILGVLLGVCLGLLMSPVAFVHTRKVMQTVGLMFVATLIATFVIENLTYVAPWHFAQVRLSSYLFVLTFSVGIGISLKSWIADPKVLSWIGGICMTVFLGIVVIQSGLVAMHIDLRATNWAKGQSSGIFFIADRDVDWVSDCWEGLSGSD